MLRLPGLKLPSRWPNDVTTRRLSSPAYLPSAPLPCSWLGVGNPFASSLGFAALVLVVEGISFADMTPRHISQYLASVSWLVY